MSKFIGSTNVLFIVCKLILYIVVSFVGGTTFVNVGQVCGAFGVVCLSIQSIANLFEWL